MSYTAIGSKSLRGGAMMNQNQSRLPYVVMAVTLAMYVCKVFAKVAVGSYVNSPMIEGDGFHNIADILESIIVITILVIARRPPTDTYPFGRKNAESIFELMVGCVLC